MKKKTVCLFGSSGMVGSGIKHILNKNNFEIREYNREKFNILKDKISNLDLSNVDYVINSAGIINKYKDRKNYLKEIKLVNTDFPNKLSVYCKELSIPFIHISTDCVFEGTKGFYMETDLTDAKDYYGSSKIKGEPIDSMILRLSVIGPEQKNFISLLNWFLNTNDECFGFKNHFWNGLTSIELGKVIIKIINNNLYEKKLFHLFSTDISKYDLLNLFKKYFNKKILIKSINTDSSKNMCLRTINNYFVSKLNILSIEDQIKEMRYLCDKNGKWI